MALIVRLLKYLHILPQRRDMPLNIEQEMKYLIVGLGNPGTGYANTRHNAGFRILEVLAKSADAVFESERYGSVVSIRHKGRMLILLKPATYMNLSGKAVNYWMKTGKNSTENLLVVVDDIALPFGTLRLRGKGSDGGHNGLKSINEILGYSNYARLRFGIGGDFPQGYQADYVLGEWSDEERDLLPERTGVACDAIRNFVTAGLTGTMNVFNNNNH
jgi:PTH1 family peptidyl-tRNA hydrolase